MLQEPREYQMNYRKPNRATVSRGIICLVSAIGALCGQVTAQTLGSQISTQVSVANVDIASCTGASAMTNVSRNCSITGAPGAEVSAQGRAVAPSPFNPLNPASYQLPEVGTSLSITSAVRYWPGNNAPASELYAPMVTAFAGTRFSDFLLLGETRPSYMILGFRLDGALEIGTTYPVPEAVELGPVKAQVSYVVGAQAGSLSGSNFGSLAPFGEGSVISDRIAQGFGFVPQQVTSNVYRYGTIGHSASQDPLNPFVTRVTITLGSEFFDNLANTGVLLDIALNTYAYSPAVFFHDGPPDASSYSGRVSADYLNTFSMDSLVAYDVNGVDITASAFQGFASANLAPVPEPELAALLLSGLGVVFLAQRRRRVLPARPSLSPCPGKSYPTCDMAQR